MVYERVTRVWGIFIPVGLLLFFPCWEVHGDLCGEWIWRHGHDPKKSIVEILRSLCETTVNCFSKASSSTIHLELPRHYSSGCLVFAAPCTLAEGFSSPRLKQTAQTGMDTTILSHGSMVQIKGATSWKALRAMPSTQPALCLLLSFFKS